MLKIFKKYFLIFINTISIQIIFIDFKLLKASWSSVQDSAARPISSCWASLVPARRLPKGTPTCQASLLAWQPWLCDHFHYPHICLGRFCHRSSLFSVSFQKCISSLDVVSCQGRFVHLLLTSPALDPVYPSFWSPSSFSTAPASASFSPLEIHVAL